MKPRIIDLLSLKSKEIDPPFKIKYKEDTYFYDGYDYFSVKGYLFEKYNAITILNDEVEVLAEETKEEKKIPEKIEEPRFKKGRYYIKDINGDDTEITGIERTLRLKINSIIDYLKSKGE